jgi:MoaA/NifB/PqqE/SkfB family radical SAM enzyme
MITRKKDDSTIPLPKIQSLVAELKECGVKAIILGGGGEASCHPDAAAIVRLIHSSGMEVGIYTNGSELSDELIDAIARSCTWVRISLDADGPEMHRVTHGLDGKLFPRVVTNIERLVERRKTSNTEMVIGTGFLVGLHTISGLYTAVKLSRDLGVDYIRVRPFYASGGYKKTSPEQSQAMMTEVRRCLDLQTATFCVSFPPLRWQWLQESAPARGYTQCHAYHFSTIISANQRVYLCCFYENDEDFCLGDLSRQTFKSLWLSERRREVCDRIDVSRCPNPCILDEHNRLLHQITNPIKHANFI